MIGPLEIAIIVLILLVLFGASFLPRLGRAAGRGIRVGTEKGKELGAAASEKAQEIDTKAIARTAGEHVREARELRDAVTGETRPAAGATGETEKPGDPGEDGAADEAGTARDVRPG